MSLRIACTTFVGLTSSRQAGSTLLRGFVTTCRARSSIADEQSAAASARRAAEQNARRNVGPFPFVGRPGSDDGPKRPWQELGRGEKVGRSITNSSNFFVIIFGLGLTGLIVYAVSSELFADNSPTHLYEQATDFVRNNPEVNSILLQPIRFHAESSGGGRRNRRIRSSLSTDRASGREKMTIRFAVEGKDPVSHADESWYQSIKRWIRPVLVEPSAPTDLIPSVPVSQPSKASDEETGWLSGVFGSILPSSFAKKAGAASEATSTQRMRTKPKKGTFQAGEAVASFILQENGKFRIESLSVFYPDANHWEWKTDVVQEHKLLQQSVDLSQSEEAPTRYRFWSRKG